MVEKKLKKVKVEIDNAINEAREIAEYCIKCGKCRKLCPVLRIARTEQFSPRGKVIMIDNNYFEKILFECTLCKACEKDCPLGLKLSTAFLKARQVIASQGKENKNLSETIRVLDRTGNIFGVKN